MAFDKAIEMVVCPSEKGKDYLTCRLTHVKTKELAQLVLGAILDDEKRAVGLKDIATNTALAINHLTARFTHFTNRGVDVANSFLHDLKPTFKYPVDFNRFLGKLLMMEFEMNSIIAVLLFLLKILLIVIILRLLQEIIFEAIDAIKYRRIRDRRILPFGAMKRSMRAMDVYHI